MGLRQRLLVVGASLGAGAALATPAMAAQTPVHSATGGPLLNANTTQTANQPSMTDRIAEAQVKLNKLNPTKGSDAYQKLVAQAKVHLDAASTAYAEHDITSARQELGAARTAIVQATKIAPKDDGLTLGEVLLFMGCAVGGSFLGAALISGGRF